jgi:hypothetical protein
MTSCPAVADPFRYEVAPRGKPVVERGRAVSGFPVLAEEPAVAIQSRAGCVQVSDVLDARRK